MGRAVDLELFLLSRWKNPQTSQGEAGGKPLLKDSQLTPSRSDGFSGMRHFRWTITVGERSWLVG